MKAIKDGHCPWRGSHCLSEARVVVAAWVGENLQKSDDVVPNFVSLLNEDILVTTPRPKGVRLPKKPEVRNLRYL